MCQYRLELRSEAPSEEAHDQAQRALEEQLHAISDARVELLGLEGECRKALEMITEPGAWTYDINDYEYNLYMHKNILFYIDL